MSYDMHAHRAAVREQLLLLARTGPGWHPYVLDQAERLTSDDPALHEGLTAAVEAQIGPQDMAAARRALAYFSKTRTRATTPTTTRRKP